MDVAPWCYKCTGWVGLDGMDHLLVLSNNNAAHKATREGIKNMCFLGQRVGGVGSLGFLTMLIIMPSI